MQFRTRTLQYRLVQNRVSVKYWLKVTKKNVVTSFKSVLLQNVPIVLRKKGPNFLQYILVPFVGWVVGEKMFYAQRNRSLEKKREKKAAVFGLLSTSVVTAIADALVFAFN